ncbi:MAG TPA: peptidase S8, partial [Roseiflexaceae bacterium]|nr:peptidase S8 [Roseiflexaceae bacterium]
IYTVQYFERRRFEFHPENQPPYHVLLSLMGRSTLERSGRDWNSLPKNGVQAGCLFFNETGQSICEPFLSYWRNHGLEFDGRRGTSLAESLALFGLPISAPQSETLADGRSYTVQWFERARFEDHGSQGVLLGLLAADLARDAGWRP